MEWFRNLEVPAQVAIITGTITMLNILVSVYLGKRNERISRENADKAALTALEVGKKNNESLEKRRFIDTISMQRIEWINNLRQAFVNFNELAAKRKLLIDGSKEINSLEHVYDENAVKLFSVKGNIELYLNPGEFFSDKLSLYLGEMINIFSDVVKINNNSLYREIADIIHFIEQVILKAEWRRIKEETEKGEQIDKVGMTKIFEEVANEINPYIYNKLKGDDYLIEFKIS